ncbi:hypothetical protein Sango_0884200 [Sesamum angolense]|uniref:Uncharacterized protein n=1 Tax=Sesamum angolense TaxID=2727404 RepID=A0AAE2BXS7_9LAMI|nr:hypothetical protein Sango_0884200 [Sesamum angolense]
MATTATTNATDQSSNSTKTVDSSLWWEPFSAFLTELESASGSSDLPQSLEKKLKDNHAWFLDTILQFKSPNQRSREALDSPRVKIGPHELIVQPEFKDTALKISSIMCLDEVQSYILVKRSMERNDAAASDIHPDILNLAVCYSLMDAWNSFHDEETGIGIQEKYVRIDVVEIICALVKNLPPSVNGAVMMSMGVTILTKMLRCLPSHVATMALKGNIFDVALRTNPFDVGPNSLSSGSWLLSGRLAKMLLIDLLDFTMNLLETGLETDTIFALTVFSLRYVLVNHEFWKYKVKYARWKVTLKVLEVMKKCIWSISSCQKLGDVVRDIMLSDSSIHSALFRIVCTTTPSLEKLYVSRLFDMLDIEGLHQAISSGLDVLVSMVYAFSKDQGIAVITELCEANKMKQLAPEIKEVCLLLLQITVMALYLEFCVIQICGIRPVLGHVETFSKEFRLLIRATEGHLFLKEPLRNLKQIVSFVYPELIQAEGLF